MYSPSLTFGSPEQWRSSSLRNKSVGHLGAPASGSAIPALLPSVFPMGAPPMTAEDIKRMDEANEWLDCLRFPVDVDTMEQLVVSHFFEAEEDHVVLAGGHAARLGVAAAEGITPESTTLDNSPVWLASNALSPAAVRAARVLNPTPLLPVVDLAYVVGKAPAERLKARELTRSEKMKMVVATAEWIYDVMRSLVDSRILTRPWCSPAHAIYREREYTVDRIGAIMASFRELSASVPILALLFVKKFASDVKHGGPLATALSSGDAFAVDEFITRAFTAGMIMADKVVDEGCFTLKTWSEITDIPLSCIGKIERAAMEVLHYNLYPSDLEWEAHIKQLHDQTTRHALLFMGASSVPPAVVMATVLRDLIACTKDGYTQSSPVFYNSLTHGTLDWLNKQWQAMKIAPTTSYATTAASVQTFSCAESTRSAVCHKRKLSANAETDWLAPADKRIVSLPSRKVSRTSLHMAVAAERERVKRAHWEETDVSWGVHAQLMTPADPAQQDRVRPAASWGAVPPQRNLAVVHKTVMGPFTQSGHALRSARRIGPMTAIHNHY